MKHRSNIVRPAWARVGGSRGWLSMRLAGLMKASTSTKIQNFQCASQRLDIAVTAIRRQGVILIRDTVRSASDQSSITNAAGARARYRGFEYILLQHQDFLKNHGAFRGKMFPRVIKYRARAGSLAGWFWFCAQLPAG